MKQTLPTVLNALVSKISSLKNSSALLVMLLLISGNVVGQIVVNNPTSPWTVPAGVTSITVYAWGAGGGGGGAAGGTGGTGDKNAGGGGGGAIAFSTLSVSSAQTYTITYGVGGAAGTSTGGNGGNGTSTTFSGTGGTVTATGGSGGIGRSTSGQGAGGSGGLVSGCVGTTSWAGGNGNTGSFTASKDYGGGGGGSAGSGSAGGNGSTINTGGSAGTGTYPGIIGGAGANTAASAVGTAGGSKGAGGGGAACYATSTSRAGGAGAAGYITIIYTLPSNTWNGSTSTDWNTASNWSFGTVPISTNDVVIATATNQPVIGAAATCANITLNSGTSLAINSTLAVGGNWNNNSSASAVSGSGTVTFSGTTSIGGSFATTFPNLTISGGTTTNTITGTSVAGTYSQTAGTFIMSTSASNVYTLNFKDISLTGTGIVSTSTGTLTGISTIINITGSYTQGAGTTWDTPGSGVGQMNFTGGGNTTYSNSGTISYNGIKVTNNTTLTLLSNLTFTGWLTSGTNLILESGSFLSAGTYTITNTSTGITWSILGTIKTANSNGLSGSTTTTLVSTNTPTITLGAASTVEYNAAGAQTVTARTDYANVTLSGSGIKTFTATPTIAGKLSIQGTATTASATPTFGASATLEYKGSAAQTTGVEFPATFIGSGGVIINNANGVTLGASKAISSGLTLTSGAFASGAYTLTYSGTGSSITRTNGTLDISNANGGLTFTNTTTALTLPASLFTGNIKNLTMNGTGGVTLNNAVTLSGILTLTSGQLTTTSSNLLTISNTARSAVSSGSSSSYVNGPIALTLPASLVTGSTYLFPIGKGTYNPISLVNPTTTSGGTVTVNSEVFDSNAGGTAGTGLGSLNTNRYWAASITSGSVNFTNTLIKLDDSSVASISAVTSSTTLTGTYDIVGGTSPTVVVGTSVTSVTPEATTLPGYFAIGSFPLPMSYSSSTTTQNVTSITQTNTSNQQIIGMQVVTSGNTSPLDATSFTINTTGTTSASTDITNAKIWYTGTSATFATTTQFGSAVASPNGSHDITGTQTLSEGTNYFWLTYDIPTSATTNNLVDAQFTAVTVGGTSQIPTVSSPTGTRTIKGVLNGVYNIGASQVAPNYTLLTNAIADLGNYGVSGAVTFQLMSGYSSATETFPLTINAYTGASASNTLTIKPANGVTATISGSSASSIFKFNGADYVTIDGSNNGGTDKSLSISNSNTGTSSAIVWVASASVSDGATNNTIKNCVISGNAPTTTYCGIVSSSGTTITNPAEAANLNNTYNNNILNTSWNGIALLGVVGNEANNTITNNSIGSTITNNKIGSTGIYVSNQANFNVSNNTVFGVSYSGANFISGISINGTISGGTVSKNKISDIKNPSLTGYPAYGIYLNSTSILANVILSNNFLFDIAAYGNATTREYNGHGIVIYSGGGYSIYNNTVNMNTSQSVAARASALFVQSGLTTSNSGNINIINNIFSNTQTTNATSSVAIYSSSINTIYSSINYNNYFCSNTLIGGYYNSTGGLSTTTSFTSLMTNIGSTVGNLNVLPTFVASATDLHLSPVATASGNAALKAGTYISSVLTDYDGETRNVTVPAIGADEIFINGLWTGATSTVWDGAVTGNWDDGTLPANAADIVVPAGVTNSPVLTGISPTIGKLNLGNNKTLTLGANTLTINGAVSGAGTLKGAASSSLTTTGTAGTLNFDQTTIGTTNVLKDLTISTGSATLGNALNITAGSSSGTVTVGTGATLTTGSNLTLKSDANGTARIGTTTGTISGNATVERYVPFGKRAYRLLTPSVTTTGFIYANWQISGATTAGRGIQITGSTTVANGFDVTASGNPSMYTYQNNATTGTGWLAIPNTNATTLSAGTGYRTLVRGDRNVDISVASTDNMNVATTLSATGTLKVGNVVFNSTTTPALNNTINTTSNPTTNDFSLIGNPYASPVDWSLVTKVNVGDTYYTWDPNMGTAAQRGRYVAYSATSATNDVSGSAVSQYIQPGQAFFVKTTAASPVLTFKETDKASSFTNVFRTNETNSKFSISVYNPTEVAFAAPIDGTTAIFGTDFNATIGLGDAEKLFSAGESLAWSRGTKLLAIDAQAPAVANDELHLKTMQFVANKSYTFKINATNFDTSLSAFLVDQYLNTQTQVDLTAPNFVTFATTADAASYGADRFKVVFSPSSALNNEEWSSKSLRIYPNPVVDNQFTIAVYPSITDKVAITIYNMIGQSVYKQTASAINNAIVVRPSVLLKAGIYMVEMVNNGKTSTQKIIIK